MSVGLILAAGASRRLGQPKQLVRYEGRTLLCWTVEQMMSAGIRQVVVVLGSHSREIAAILNEEYRGELEIIQNDDWRVGQSSSLSRGLRHLAQDKRNWQSAALALCDQPLVTAAHYQTLGQALEDDSLGVAATRYPDGGGVPAVIRREYWQALLNSLSGDSGAKHWIRSLPANRVALIDFPAAMIDVDVASDLTQVRGTSKTHSR